MLKIKHVNFKLSNRRKVKISVGVYRNGRGGVYMYMTSILHEHQWDLVIKYQKEADRHSALVKSFQEDTKLQLMYMGFKEEYSSLSKQDATQLKQDCINELFLDDDLKLFCEMVTTLQSNPSWFLMRALSFTSSGAHQIMGIIHRFKDNT